MNHMGNHLEDRFSTREDAGEALLDIELNWLAGYWSERSGKFQTVVDPRTGEIVEYQGDKYLLR